MQIKPLLERILANHGYLNGSDVEELATVDRLRNVLVRCGCCRFTCAAQDVNHLLEIIASDGRDYVRDVSLLASDDAHRGVYRLHTFEGQSKPVATPGPKNRNRTGFPDHMFREEDFGGAFDGFHVTSDADPGL